MAPIKTYSRELLKHVLPCLIRFWPKFFGQWDQNKSNIIYIAHMGLTWIPPILLFSWTLCRVYMCVCKIRNEIFFLLEMSSILFSPSVCQTDAVKMTKNNKYSFCQGSPLKHIISTTSACVCGCVWLPNLRADQLAQKRMLTASLESTVVIIQSNTCVHLSPGCICAILVKQIKLIASVRDLCFHQHFPVRHSKACFRH